MNTPSEEPTRNAQVTGEAELNQAHGRLHEELTKGRALLPKASEEEAPVGSQIRTHPRGSSRRKMLTKGLGMAAVVSVGAGALLQLSGGTAQAANIPKKGIFTSSKAGTPAVSATGTNGADGVDATSDSGTGVSATSSSGTALVATTSTGLAGHFVGGNVNIDKNLTVTGALSTGTLSSGAGALTSSVSGTPAVKATGTNGADGVDASSDSGIGVLGNSNNIGVEGDGDKFGVLGNTTTGIGVYGFSGNIGVQGVSGNGIGISGESDGSNGTGVYGSSSSGTGVHGLTQSGLAGLFDGNVQVNGNFSATGTKNFVQAHPTDPTREIVYVALEGGEAGTYVRGSGQLVHGKAVIALPEHFGLVTETSGLTVQLTSRGEWLQLYVVELDTTQLVVRETQGKSGAFDYLIHGVRSGYEQYEVIRSKR